MGSQGFLACPEGYLGGPSWLKIPGTWKKIPARWHFLARLGNHLSPGRPGERCSSKLLEIYSSRNGKKRLVWRAGSAHAALKILVPSSPRSFRSIDATLRCAWADSDLILGTLVCSGYLKQGCERRRRRRSGLRIWPSLCLIYKFSEQK